MNSMADLNGEQEHIWLIRIYRHACKYVKTALLNGVGDLKTSKIEGLKVRNSEDDESWCWKKGIVQVR